jgi:hypothetical protein
MDSFEAAKAVGGCGSSARHFLGVAVRCMLQNLDLEGMRILLKARQYVCYSQSVSEIPKRALQYIDAEPFIRNGYMALGLQVLGLCAWLLSSKHDEESYRLYVEHQDRFLRQSPGGKDKVNISLTLPTYLSACAYERVLEIFANTRGWVVPSALGSIKTESHLCFVIASHRLGKAYSADEVQNATARFLTRKMMAWLRDGHAVRAAEWMKIVYWTRHQADPSPKKALMKCYDHLPGVKRPWAS